MATENKLHWYDGWFYETFIAPNQDSLFQQIRGLIQPNASIIDIGCGTGRFSFSIADKCSTVLGIDISSRNIDRAQHILSRNMDDKITFMHAGIGELAAENNRHFDYAVLTYVIHEVDEAERVHLLHAAAAIADSIIIGDYLVPKPAGTRSWVNEIVEFAAGDEHYKNYKNFVSNGGIRTLVHAAGLTVVQDVHNSPATSHIVVTAAR